MKVAVRLSSDDRVEFPSRGQPAPGLAITHAVRDDGWVVTHIESGMKLCGPMPLGKVRQFGKAIAPLADWTLPESWFRVEKNRGPLFRKVHTVLMEIDPPDRGF